MAAGGDNLRVLGLTGVIPKAGGIPIVVNGKLIGAIDVPVAASIKTLRSASVEPAR
jgi:hypothetical protein